MLNATCSLHTFSSHHLEQVALELLKAGADANAVQQNELKWTALMFAAQNGHAQVCSSRTAGVCMVEFSLAHLHMFCSHHLDQVARELLKAGAAVDATEEDDYTALMFAAQNGHEEVSSSRLSRVCERNARFAHAYSRHCFPPSRSGRPGTAQGEV